MFSTEISAATARVRSNLDPSDKYFGNVRHDVLAMLPTYVGTVLDVGCGTGATGAALLDGDRAEAVDGIEVNLAASDQARSHYRDVWSVDLDSPEAADWLRADLGSTYDTIMGNDVLEHLRDPWSIVDALACLLSPGGRIVISVPNIQCIEVVGPLLFGRFDYQDSGILDRTHLRFFTRRTGRELLSRSGLRVVEESVGRVGESRSTAIRAFAGLLGPFGIRQLLYRAESSTTASHRTATG